MSGDTGLRGWRPGFGPLSLRSDLTGHRGLGEKRKERARARLRASGKERRRESAPAPERVPSWALMHMFKKGVTCIQAVTCIEQAWAPQEQDSAEPTTREDGRVGGPRRRGQLPTAPAPPPAQTCSRCAGRTRSGQLAALSAVDAGVPTTRAFVRRARGGVEVPMGPTLLVIASRFRPVWRRPCTCWRSAPGRASTDSARARRRLPLGI